MITRAASLINSGKISNAALFEARRVEKNKPSLKPFHFRFQKETQRRYCTVAKQLLIYFFRCLDEDPSLGSSEAKRPPWILTPKQQELSETLGSLCDGLEQTWQQVQGNTHHPRLLRQLDKLH